MTTALALSILISPVALSGAIAWLHHRFTTRWPPPGIPPTGDRDLDRMAAEAAAVRARFERHPAWPSSGALGERR
ncbi:hypothetical protein [uncultured Mycolicibacterium sp.]|uniref:hypothetical protein n=1 Tax=uncultured Mycolicibacterium sp. TaxID=2320817 RepID=UPI00261F7346|nr:hypothetical protein [uncultured Mycolicibacterium sp.]